MDSFLEEIKRLAGYTDLQGSHILKRRWSDCVRSLFLNVALDREQVQREKKFGETAKRKKPGECSSTRTGKV